MNAFDKINPDTAEMLEGDVALLEQGPKAPEAPVVPKDPMLTEGVEIVNVKLFSGSCNYYFEVSNKDGSRATRQPADSDNVNIMAKDSDGPNRYDGYAYARYNSGGYAGFSSEGHYSFIARAKSW